LAAVGRRGGRVNAAADGGAQLLRLDQLAEPLVLARLDARLADSQPSAPIALTAAAANIAAANIAAAIVLGRSQELGQTW
jgi:hypothetical protein